VPVALDPNLENEKFTLRNPDKNTGDVFGNPGNSRKSHKRLHCLLLELVHVSRKPTRPLFLPVALEDLRNALILTELLLHALNEATGS